MRTLRLLVRYAREHWLLAVAILVNLAIAGPVAASWDNDVCVVNGQAVPCCTSCYFFCSCGESPAP